MADTLVIFGCVVALAGSFILLYYSRCQHLRMSYGGMRCADCGLPSRKIAVDYLLGTDSRKPNFICMGRCKFDPVFQYVRYRLEKAPPSLRYTYIETEELVPETPPHIRELYEEMKFRQQGISYLWKKHAQTSLS